MGDEIELNLGAHFHVGDFAGFFPKCLRKFLFRAEKAQKYKVVCVGLLSKQREKVSIKAASQQL